MLRSAVISIGLIAFMSMLATGCDQSSTSTTSSTSSEPSSAPVNSAAAHTPASATTPTIEPVVLRYTVKGMHCGGCETALEAKLAQVPGVVSCDASFEKQSAEVAVNDPAVADDVFQTIAGIGYEVEPVEPAHGTEG